LTLRPGSASTSMDSKSPASRRERCPSSAASHAAIRSRSCARRHSASAAVGAAAAVRCGAHRPGGWRRSIERRTAGREALLRSDCGAPHGTRSTRPCVSCCWRSPRASCCRNGRIEAPARAGSCAASTCCSWSGDCAAYLKASIPRRFVDQRWMFALDQLAVEHRQGEVAVRPNHAAVAALIRSQDLAT
jgi:hypothetical protein